MFVIFLPFNFSTLRKGAAKQNKQTRASTLLRAKLLVPSGSHPSIDENDDTMSVTSLLRVGHPQSMVASGSHPATDENDDAMSVTSYASTRRGIKLRPPRRFRNDDDDMSVGSFTSVRSSRVTPGRKSRAGHIEVAKGLQNRLDGSIVDHDESVEALHAQLEAAKAQHNEMKALLEAEKQKTKTCPPPEAEQTSSIGENHDLKASLQVATQKVERSIETQAKLNQLLDEQKQKVKNLESEQGSVNEHHDWKQLFELEKRKNEALAQSQDKLHQLLEEDKQQDAIVHSFKADSREALEQDMVKMQNTLNEVEKSSSHTRLRLIKNQKLLTLERDKTSTLEDGLDTMTQRLDTEKQQLQSLEKSREKDQDKLYSQKEHLDDIMEKQQETQLFLEAEQSKVGDLRRSLEEKSQMWSSESQNLQDLERAHSETQRELELERMNNGNLQIEQDKLTSLVESMENSLVEKEAYRLSSGGELEVLEQANAETQKELEGERVENDNHQTEQAKLRDQVQSLERTLIEKEMTFSDSKQNFETIEQGSLNTQKELQTEREKNEILLTEEAKLSALVECLQKSLEERDSLLSNSKSTLEIREQRFFETENDLETERAKVKDLLEGQSKLIGLIESLKETLQDRESRLSDSQQNLKVLDLDNSTLKADFGAEQSKARHLQEDKFKLRGQVDTLEQKLNTEESLRVDAEEKFQTLEQIHSEMKADFGTEQGTSTQLRGEKSELTDLVESLKNSLHDTECLLSDSKQTCEALELELVGAQKDIVSEREMSENLHSEVAKLTGLVESLQKTLQDEETNRSTTEKKCEALELAQTTVKAEFEAEQETTEILRTERSELADLVMSLRNGLHDKESLLSESEQSSDALELERVSTLKTLENEHQRTKHLLEEQSKLNDQVQSLEKQLQEEESRHLASGDKCERIEQASSAMKADFEDAQENVKHLLEEQTRLSDLVESLQKNIDGKESLLSFEKETLETLEALQGETEADLEAERVRVGLLLREQTELIDNVEALEKVLEGKESTLLRQKKNVQDMQNAHVKLQTELESEQDQAKQLREEQAKLTNDLDSAAKSSKTLEMALDKRDMILMSEKEKLSAVEEELQSERGNLKKLQEEQKDLHNLIRSVNEKFESEQKKTMDLLEEERERVNDLQQKGIKAEELMESGQTALYSVKQQFQMARAFMELKDKKMRSLAETEREASLSFKFAYEKGRVLMTLKDKEISTLEEAERKSSLSLKAADENLLDLEKSNQTLVGDLEVNRKNIAVLETKHAESKKHLSEEQSKVSDLEVRLKDGQLLVESGKSKVEELEQLLVSNKKEGEFELSKIKSLLKSQHRRVEELEKSNASFKSELKSEQRRVKDLELEQGRKHLLLETQKNKIKEMEHSREKLETLLESDRQNIEALKQTQIEMETRLQEKGARLVEATKADETKMQEIASLSEHLSCFESMKSDLVSTSLSLRQRDLLLIAMLETISRNKRSASDESVEKVKSFVADLSRKTGLTFLEDESQASGGALTTASSKFRRIGYQLCWTLPLVPIVAYGPKDPSILTEPILAMFGMAS
jgi:chromosome segregation ATPase